MDKKIRQWINRGRRAACDQGERGEYVDPARALTVGEWNYHDSMGEEEGQCGPQNGCNLVTTNVGAICFL
jgi:hypothetical protein